MGVRLIIRLSIICILLLTGSVFTSCGGSRVTISSLTISPEKVAPDQPVTIAANILNSGKTTEEYAAELKVNETRIETKQVPVGAGETKTISFQYTATDLGAYTVDVNGRTGMFDVVKPASFVAESVTVTPDPPMLGRELTTTVTVRNTGELPGIFNARLKVDGKDTSSVDATIEAGALMEVPVKFSVDTAGMHTVELGGISKEVKVFKPAEFKVTSVSVSPSSMLTGESATVQATITNTGDIKDTQSIPLLVNGTEAGSQTVVLEPGATGTATYAITRDATGTYSLSVKGTITWLTVFELNKYSSKAFFYSISYPPGYTVDDSVTTAVSIEKGDTASIAVYIDRLDVTQTPRNYLDAVVQEMKAESPDFASSAQSEVQESGAVIGYRFNVAWTEAGKKWVGRGTVLKKGGYGFYARFATVGTEWEQNRAIAPRVIDSFSIPAIYTGAYSSASLGVGFTLPQGWDVLETGSSTRPLSFASPAGQAAVAGQLVVETVPAGTTAQQYGSSLVALMTASGYQVAQQGPFTFTTGASGYEVILSTTTSPAAKFRIVMAVSGTRATTILLYGLGTAIDTQAAALTSLLRSLVLTAPGAANVNKNESLFLLGGEVPTLDPAMTEDAAGDAIGALFGGLVKLDKDLSMTGDLAERWIVSADGKTYTFYLRKNAKFHDGKAVTAADVKYSWERACDPALKSPKANYFLNDIVGAKDRMDGKAAQISGIKVIDNYTLEVTLDAAKQYFLDKLAQPVAFVVDRANVAKGTKWYEQLNGTGPFKLKTWEKDNLLVLERFDDYHLGPAKLKNLVFKLFAGNSMQLYESGEIDITGVGTANLDRVLDTTNPLNKELVTGSSLSVFYLGYNVSKPPFDDPKVRQAFALAVDVPKVIEVALKGRADRAAGYVPEGVPGFNSSLQPVPFDPAQAKQFIAQSKYQSVDRLPAITLLSFGSLSPTEQAIIGMWQQNLGVQVKVETVTELTTYMERIRREDYQLDIGGWNADYVDPQNFLEVLFQSQSNENHFAYSSAAVDAALVLAAADPDEAARIRKYQEIERQILADLPAVPLYRNIRSYVLVKPYVKGYVLTPISVNIWAEISVVAH